MAYIKFQRGSLAAYNALAVKDPNTLYFIYAKEGSSVGSLYLGESLISGGDTILQSAKLDDLADVITAGAGAGDFLVKNEEGNWVPKKAADVAAEVLATLKLNSTLAVDDEGSLGIAGFDAAENGSQLMKNDAGKLVWVKPSAETIEGIQTTVAGLQSSVETLDGEVDKVVEDVAALDTRVDSVEQNLAALEAEIGNPAEGETPASGLYAELGVIEEKLESKADKTYVDAELVKKANAADVYAKGDVDTLIANAVANAEHLKRELVDALPEIENADTNTIYMVPKDGGKDPDARNEFMLVNGAWEKIGDTAVNLTGYATEEYVTEAIKGKANIVDVEDLLNGKVDKDENARLMTIAEGTKLAGIAEGAEVNVINAVSGDFTIGENRTLTLNNIAISKVVDLENILNGKADKKDVDALEVRVKDIEDQLEMSLTWVEMEEPNI